MGCKEIRLLHADEIECRIASASEYGVSLVLYKDARVDQKILDETFTPFGWKRSHQMIEGNPLRYGIRKKTNGSESRMSGRKAIQKKKRGRLLTASREHV